jgi:hypothetical protein
VTAAVLSGARLAAERVGARFAGVTAVFSMAGVALVAILERRGTPLRAADHTLLGAVFGIAIPLVAYATVSHAGREGFAGVLDGVARWGPSRRHVAVGFLLALGGFAALLSAVLTVTGVTLARGLADPAWAADCATSLRIALLGGAAYTSFFALGLPFSRRRLWAFALLAGDWVLGSTTSAVSAPWPRSHLRNLLGAEPVLGMTQGQGFLVLAAVSVACLGVVLALTRD